MGKKFKNGTVLGYDDKPVKMVRGEATNPIEMTLKEILWLVLNNSPMASQNDSIQGARLAQALDAATDFIEMEDGVYDWLVTVAEKVTPPLFKINGDRVYKHICEKFEPEEKVQEA